MELHNIHGNNRLMKYLLLTHNVQLSLACVVYIGHIRPGHIALDRGETVHILYTATGIYEVMEPIFNQLLISDWHSSVGFNFRRFPWIIVCTHFANIEKLK